MKLKVINLFGGPGTGKSTTRAMLFSIMKQCHMNVEEVTEYAKDVTWERNFDLFSDQLFVLANQNRRLSRLQNKVEWAVSDSPLLLSIHYVTPEYLPRNFQNLVFEVWDLYDNYNFLIERNKPYSPIGRNQTEDEAKKIDQDIISMLEDKKIEYKTIKCGETAAAEIFNHVFGEEITQPIPFDLLKYLIRSSTNGIEEEVKNLVKALSGSLSKVEAIEELKKLFTSFKK